MSRNNLIQFRKGTFADFTGVNPVLASGEPGYAIDTKTLKIGDGTTAWNSLSSLSGLGIDNVVEDLTPQLGGNLDLNSNNIRGSGNISLIGNVDVTGNLDIDGNGTFNRVGIGTDGPTVGLQVEQNNITFNDGGGNFDFRVEGDTDPNLFFTDASTDGIGIGTNNPGGNKVRIQKSGTFNSENTSAIKIDDGTSVMGGLLGADPVANVFYVQSVDPGTSYATKSLALNPNSSGMTNPGSVGIGTTNPTRNLTHCGTTALIASGSIYELDISASAATLGLNRLQLLGTETVFNNAGSNFDFRVEGDTDQYLIFVDASTDRVGIGTATPQTLVDISGTVTASGYSVPNQSGFLKANATVDNNIYATTGLLNIVSGILQTNISTTSGVLQTNINRVPYVSGVTYNSATHSLLLSRNSGSNITGILTNVAHSGDNISIFTNDVPYLPTGDLNTTLQAGTGLSVVYDSGNRTLTFNTDTSVFVTGVSYNSGTHSLILSRNSGSVTGVLNGIIHSGDNVSFLANDTGYITTGVFNTHLQAGTGISLAYDSGNTTLTIHTDTSVFVTGVSYNSGSHSLVLSRNSGSITGVLNGIIHSGDNISSLVNNVPYAISGTHIAITNAASNINNSSNDFVQDLLFDQFGHVTGVVSQTVTDNDVNTFVTGITYNSATHSLVLDRNAGSVTGVLNNVIHSGDNISFLTNDASYATTGLVNAVSGVLANANTFVTGVVFNSGNNNLVLARNIGASVTGNLQGVLVSGTTYHKSISAASSSNNAGRTYIQDVLLDTHGHVTGLATASETVTDTNTQYTAGTGLELSGSTQFNIDSTVLTTGNLIAGTGLNFNSVAKRLDVDSTVLTTGSSISSLSNVNLSAPVNSDQILKYDGGNFVNTDLGLNLMKRGSIPFGGYSDAQMGHYFFFDGSSEAVINTDGDDINFRVEGSGGTNLLFTDGGTQKVGIGTNTPSYTLDVVGSGSFDVLNINNAFTFPTGDGTAGHSLVTDGAGNIIFSGVTSGGGGDITAVTAGTGLSGGGTTGAVTLNAVSATTSVTGIVKLTNTINGDQDKALTPKAVNDAGYLTAHPNITSVSSSNNSGRTYIQDILLDSNGHITGIATAAETVTDTNTFTTGIVFNTGNKSLVLNRDGGSVTGTLTNVLVSGNNISLLNNDASYLTAHPNISAASSSNNSGSTFIQDVLLDSNGHVTGVATAAAGSIDGSGTANYTAKWTDADTLTSGIIYDNGTNIGIGTASPTHKLDVTYTDGRCVRFADSGGSGVMLGDCALSGNAGYAGIKHTDMAGSNDYMIVSDGSDTYISAKDGESVFIRGGGNAAQAEIRVHDVGAGGVGIVFNEAGSDRDIRMEGTSDTNLFRLDASTNRIGIGTATPATKLDVDGTITASGGEVLTTGTLNTKLQAGAGITLNYSSTDSTLEIQNTSLSTVEGRLTLESGVPVSTGNLTAQTKLYFSPYKGNRIALYDGSNWKGHTFNQLELSLSGYTADKNFDIFVHATGGAPTLESVVWTNDSTRATALTTQDNVYVKNGATTRRYLGTVRTTSSTGETEDSTERRFVWSYYNQVYKRQRAQVSALHTYTTNTWRAWNNNTTVGETRILFVLGLPQFVEANQCTHHRYQYANWGLDSTNTQAPNSLSSHNGDTSSFTSSTAAHGMYIDAGYHFIQALEYGLATHGGSNNVELEAYLQC